MNIRVLKLAAHAGAVLLSTVTAGAALAQPAIGPPVFAGIFGSRNLTVENPNNPGTNYTVVHHSGNDNTNGAVDALEYDSGRGWGFEVLDPGNTGLGGFARFGPFDDSTNGRGEFDDNLIDQIYDSFIGMKGHPMTCMVGNPAGITDMNQPCSPTIPASGGVFRIDVPNGQYRFVGAFGEADNPHAHRVLVEDGGSGPPADGIGNHVVLVHNHDQAQWDLSQLDEGGDGVFAAVGFLDKQPPAPQGTGNVPILLNMDANGMPAGGDGTGPMDSPVLTVTEGYIRVHLLQGNSNDGPGGTRDANGTDIVLFEAYPVGGEFTPGDVNGDSMVDILDYEIIRDNFRNTGVSLSEGDLNFDRTVDFQDFIIWRDAFNAAPAPVPEPGALAICGLGFMCLTTRRWRIARRRGIA